tara:strand:- start:435 stop:794 length:360 start_codon:yes stop_codon:yes gene_type:complete
MSPFDAVTTTAFFEGDSRLDTEGDIGDKRQITLTTKDGRILKGFVSYLSITDVEGEFDFRAVLVSFPESGFAAATRTGSITIFEKKETLFLTLMALAAKMGDHGIDVKFPRTKGNQNGT